MFRVFQRLVFFGVGGIALSLLLAFVVCAFQNFRPFSRLVRGPVDFGRGEMSSEGRTWIWQGQGGLGWNKMEIQIVDQQFAEKWDADRAWDDLNTNWKRTNPPNWSIVAQERFPQHVRQTQREAWPSMEEWAFGWPARCLYYRKEYLDERMMSQPSLSELTSPNPTMVMRPTFMISSRNSVFAKIMPGWPKSHNGDWPIQPFWPGLIWNSLCMSLLLALPFSIGAIRRIWRRRSGRCVACGYSRHGLKDGPCPECGHREAMAAIPAKSVEMQTFENLPRS